MSMTNADSVDVIVDGAVYCTLIRDAPPEKQVKQTRKRRAAGGDEEAHEEFDKGHKLHAHSDSNDVHAAFFIGAKRAKISVPDRTRPGSYQKYLRGLTQEDLEGLFQSTGRLLDLIDEYLEDLHKP
jgi:hypothetical protein